MIALTTDFTDANFTNEWVYQEVEEALLKMAAVTPDMPTVKDCKKIYI